MIRVMTREDVAAVAALEKELFADPWNEKQLEDAVIFHPEDVFVFEEGQVIGYLLLMHAADEGELLRIGVAPEHRRKGIGRRLMGHLNTWSMFYGVSTVFLEVRAHNEAAIALYEGQGFQSLGTRKNYYKDPVEDAIIMNKGYAQALSMMPESWV